MSGKHKLLAVLLLTLAAGNAALVESSQTSARRGMAAAQAERLEALRAGFDIAVGAAETKLTEIAAFSVETEDVRDLLAAALAALARNGGDQHAPEVEAVRRQLADVIGRRWTRLQFHYMLRQFGFYLPPDRTAFYRAEAPHRYGDGAAAADSLPALVAATGRPATGFAVDSLTTGVRAAAPVYIDGRWAVAEAGTAFDPILAPICPNSHCGVAVLLPRGDVVARMTAIDFNEQFTENRRIGDWLMEASTNPAVTRALLAPERGDPALRPAGEPVQIGARWFATMTFPLRDHLGKDDPSRPDAGRVLIWLNVDEAMKALDEARRRNITAAIVGFVVIGGLIWWLMRLATARLEAEVRRRTSEVQSLLEEVSFLAERDPLTGLYNRRVFGQRLHAEIARAQRSGQGFAVVSIDLDHFKQINDRHGHPMGDQVLCLLAGLVRDSVRAQDVAARLGGEEFALLLPATDAAGAVALAERLKAELAAAQIPLAEGGALTVTFSAGVALWRAEADEASMLRDVDRALYRAKAAGRNRVQVDDGVAAV